MVFKKYKKIITFVILIALVPSPAHAGWFDSLWSSVKENATKVVGVFAAAATATAAFLGYKWWQASKKAETLRNAKKELGRKINDTEIESKKALKALKEQSDEKINTELKNCAEHNNQLQQALDASQAQSNNQNVELKRQKQALDDSKQEHEKRAQTHAQELQRNKDQAATLIANLQAQNADLQRIHAAHKENVRARQESAQMAQEELQQRLHQTTAAYNALLKDSAIRKAFETYNSENPEKRAEALKSLAKALNIELSKEQMEGPLAFHQFVLENYATITEKVTTDKYLSSLVKHFNETAPWTRGLKLVNELLKQPESLSSSPHTAFVTIENQSILPNIVNLVWYFYELAVRKGQKFTDGTFNIEGEELFDIISNYSTKSSRSGSGSSHYKEVETEQCGIDIPENQRMAWSFPNNKFHLLFGDISTSQYIKDTGKFIFFAKPESSGISSASDFAHHASQFAASQARKFLPSSTSAALGLGSDDDQTYRKERVEQEIIKLATKHFGDNSTTEDTKTYGIKALVQQVKKDKHPDLFAKIHEYDHLELRKGREVILLRDDLLNGTKKSPSSSPSTTPTPVVTSSTSSASVSTRVASTSTVEEKKSI